MFSFCFCKKFISCICLVLFLDSSFWFIGFCAYPFSFHILESACQYLQKNPNATVPGLKHNLYGWPGGSFFLWVWGARQADCCWIIKVFLITVICHLFSTNQRQRFGKAGASWEGHFLNFTLLLMPVVIDSLSSQHFLRALSHARALAETGWVQGMNQGH